MKTKIKIAGSILSADFGRLNEVIASVEPDLDWLHVDVMDHHFVPNLSFGIPIIKSVKTKLPLDCHLMVENPELYLEELAKIGVYSVTVHAEACRHLNSVIASIKALKMKASVAINPATPVLLLKEVVADLDMVLVMSVNPGFGGQKFITNTVAKIRELKQLRSDLLVEVDGGINAETGRLCREAGADILVAGSYIFGAADKKAAIQALRD